MTLQVILADLETISVEAFASLDYQGKPSFGAAVSLQAHVRRTDTFVLQSDGSKTLAPLLVYVPGDASYLPQEKDKVTVDSEEFVVLESDPRRRLGRSRSADPDHVRLKCGLGGV